MLHSCWEDRPTAPPAHVDFDPARWYIGRMEPPPKDFNAYFAELCCGDLDAEEFCLAFLAWCHLIDDSLDGEMGKWSHRQIMRVGLMAVTAFAANPFYQQHRADLWPLVLNSFAAYGDSENGQHDPRMREVLKTQYQEVFLHVARLAGGWEFYRAMCAKHREATP